MNSQNPYLLFLVFFIFFSKNSFAQTDTIHLDLDSISLTDKIVQINHAIPTKKCGLGNLSIPIVLKGSDTSKVYVIIGFVGNGDSAISKKKSNSNIILPNTGTAVVDWQLSENLNRADCTQNRQVLFLRLRYSINDIAEGGQYDYHEKIIRLSYHYTD